MFLWEAVMCIGVYTENWYCKLCCFLLISFFTLSKQQKKRLPLKSYCLHSSVPVTLQTFLSIKFFCALFHESVDA